MSPLALLLPAAMGGASDAAAAPAAGYTASLIQTGQQISYVAVDPATDTAYTAGELSKEISVVDAATSAVTGTISLPAGARGIAVDAVTDTVYVTLAQGTSNPAAVVDVIDGATNTVTSTVTLPSGSVPAAVAVDSSTDTVYVVEQGAAAIAVIDGSTNSVTTTISTGTGTHPYALAVDETSDVVWVGETTGDVLAISGSSNSVTQTISFTGGALTSVAVAVDPVTDMVYSATTPGGSVAIIDGATGTVSATITGQLNSVDALAVDAGSGTVFASTVAGTGGTGTTWIIDATSNAITDTIARGGRRVAVDAATGSAYIAPAGEQPDAVSVLTPSTSDALSPIITSPTAVIFHPGTLGSFAVTASALPAATYTETGQLPAGVTFSSSGVLAGTAAAGTGGSYPITITASNGVAPDYSQAFTLTVAELPVITSASQATFTVGVAGSFAVTATGSPSPTLSESGALPAGVTFTSAGVLSGTPAAGTVNVWSIQISASSAAGTVSQAFTLVVAPPATTTAAPVVLDSFGFVTLYTIRSDGNIWSDNELSPGGPFFDSWRQLTTTGDFVGTPTVIETSQANIGIYARTTAGTIMGASQIGPEGPISAWTQLGAATNVVSDPTALLTGSGVVAVYTADSGGGIEGISQSTAGGPFGSWQALSGNDGFAGHPAVLQTKSGIIAIYARTSAGTILGTSQHAVGGAFGSWGKLGSAANVASDPTVLLTTSGVIALYATNVGGAIEGISQSAPYSAFGSWQTLSPGEGFAGRPVVLQTSSGVIALYAHTSAGTVLGTSQSVTGGAFGSWGQIGTASDLVSDPTALISGSGAGVIEIYASDSTGGVSGIIQSAPYGPFMSWLEIGA